MTMPRIGTIVDYKLSTYDVESINRRRLDLRKGVSALWPTWAQAHVGNDVHVGDVFPMMVVRLWSGSQYLQGQVFLDGNDQHWVTSVEEGEGEGQWQRPVGA